jgi:hypothetical protein
MTNAATALATNPSSVSHVMVIDRTVTADMGAVFPARWVISCQAQEAAAELALTCRDVGHLCLQAVAGMIRIVPSNPSVSAFTSCPASWTCAPSRNPSTTVPFITTDPVTLLRTPLR